MSDALQSQYILVRINTLVLLEHMSKLLIRARGNSEMEKIMIHVLNNFEIEHLQSEVEAVCCNQKKRKLFQTMKYHFGESYGTLLTLKQELGRFPPPKHTFFIPPLTVDKYRNPKRAILFYSDEHFFPIDFRSFTFNEYSIFVDSNPVYDPEVNLIIRDVSNDICRIRAKFLYINDKNARIPVKLASVDINEVKKRYNHKKAKIPAKLASAHTNEIKKYMFLLINKDRYFRVLAIYPKDFVSRVSVQHIEVSPNSLS